MDLKKAQLLLHKIEAFLDSGNSQNISRLEKDLMKSYIVQLYDAVTDETASTIPVEEKPIEFVEYKMPKREPAPKVEVPQVKEVEAIRPSYTDRSEAAPKEKSADVEIQIQSPKKTTPVVEAATYHQTISEPVPEIKKAAKANPPAVDSKEALEKLFDLPKMDEMSGRFSHVPITNIETALGLNDRIFTLNELFGGDKALFDATCSRLNHLNSYAEARTLLMAGPALEFSWSEPERIKMAEQFIRIVSRRYPKSVS